MDMKRRLKMKCSSCGYWNRIPVNKIFVEQSTSEPKVKALIPMYKPLKTERCEKCGKVMAEPKELIRISARFQYVTEIDDTKIFRKTE